MTSENPLFRGMVQPCPSNREPIRVVLISSPEGGREAIHQIHLARFREATTWSPLLPTPEPDMVMSINTHYRATNR